MEPTAEFEVYHDDEAVRFCVEASEYVPMKVNCWVPPWPIDTFDGVKDTDVRTGGVTVNVADAVTLPTEALIVVPPWPSPVASPVASTPAIKGAEELHCAEFVTFCVE